MKKRNIVAILAALVLALTLFAACGDGQKGNEEPSTVVGADGQVYEEVTEIVSEIVSEIITEIKSEVVTVAKTEAVTDKQGEKVTNSKGEIKTEKVTNAKGEAETVTEIVTEVVTEVVTELVTSVESVTIPYEPETETKAPDKEDDKNNTSTPSADATEGDFAEYEEQTLPAGELIPVEMGNDGKPKEPLMQKYMDASSKSRQFYLDCVIVTNETFGYESGINYKLYLKDNNMAVEMKLGAATMRLATNDGSINILFPAAKAYYSIASGDSSDLSDEMDMAIWDTIGSTTMDYVSTSKVTIKKTTYTCEEYSDGTNTNKYYFDARKNLKRIEIITSDGATTILNIKDCSASVSDSIFEIPKGYTAITEQQLESLMGSFA